ncbi:MAG: hypothetical protein KY467_08540 [Gemmatimonadetes bacterium]|nr:hypothetical protein [Gemmatimonadota bacterium]
MRARTVAALAAAAVALACASAAYQRVGPRRTVEGEGWCGTPAPCAVPVLGAGFPLPFLIDNPQVSVPGAIALVEDDFRPAAFLANVLVYFALALLAVRLVRTFSARQVPD